MKELFDNIAANVFKVFKDTTEFTGDLLMAVYNVKAQNIPLLNVSLEYDRIIFEKMLNYWKEQVEEQLYFIIWAKKRWTKSL